MDARNFCSLPFTEIFLGPDGMVKSCCSSRVGLGSLNDHTIDEILTSKQATRLRQSIIDGEWNVACGQCKQQEEQGVRSERQSDMESFCQENPNITNRFFKLSRLDLRWSNTCNLSCTYCYEYFSSKWANIKGITVNTLKDENEKDFLLFIEKSKDTINNVMLLGGEPLLQKQNLEFLNILNNKSIYILSNLAVPLRNNPIAEKLISQPAVTYGVSFETVDTRYEYVRHGASWDTFNSNIDYLSQRIDNFKIDAHSMYSIYSAFNLVEFYEYILSKNVFQQVFWSLLESSGESDHASVLNLPKGMKELAITEIETCTSLYPSAPGIEGLNSIKLALVDSLDKPIINKFVEEISSIERLLRKEEGKCFKDIWPSVYKGLQ